MTMPTLLVTALVSKWVSMVAGIPVRQAGLVTGLTVTSAPRAPGPVSVVFDASHPTKVAGLPRLFSAVSLRRIL